MPAVLVPDNNAYPTAEVPAADARTTQRRTRCRAISLFVVGVLFIIIGSALAYGYRDYGNNQLTDKLTSAFCFDDSKGFKLYRDAFSKENFLNRNLVLFNVTNREQVLAGAKPSVAETEPYLYHAYKYDVALTFPDTTPSSFAASFGMRVKYAGDENQLQQPISSMSGGYLKLLTTAGGETKLAAGLSGCSAICLGILAQANEFMSATPPDIMGALGFLGQAQTECAADVKRLNISAADPIGAYMTLGAQCVNVGTATLAYYNCIDGGASANNATTGEYGYPDYRKCGEIAQIMAAPVGTPNFAKALNPAQKISGLVLTRSVREIAEGYASGLLGVAQMAMVYLPQLLSTNPATAAAAMENVILFEQYTAEVCDEAAAVMAKVASGKAAQVADAMRASSSSSVTRFAAISQHCQLMPCTAESRRQLLPAGKAKQYAAGCFGFAPGYAVDSKTSPAALPRIDNIPLETAERYAAPTASAAGDGRADTEKERHATLHVPYSAYVLPRMETANACDGNLTALGQVMEYNGKTEFVVWPTEANTMQNYSAIGFPSMAQLASGSAEISNLTNQPGDTGEQWAKNTGDWQVAKVAGYNGALSPPKLLDAIDHGFEPYSDELPIYIAQLHRPVVLHTGSALREALYMDMDMDIDMDGNSNNLRGASLENGSGELQEQGTPALLFKGGAQRRRLTETKTKTRTRTAQSATTQATYTPNSKMQVNVKGLTTNRYAITKDYLDNTPGGMTPAGFEGIASLAYSTGFPSWLSLPLFVYAPPALNLTENIQLFRPDGRRVQLQLQRQIGGASGSDGDGDGEIFVPRSTDWSLQTYLDVEPVTGATINAHKRLMASFAVPQQDPKATGATATATAARNEEGIFIPSAAAATDIFAPALKPMVITPVYYLDEFQTISNEHADKLKMAIAVDDATWIVMYVLVPLGVLLVIAGTWLCIKMRNAARLEGRSASRASKLDGELYSASGKPVVGASVSGTPISALAGEKEKGKDAAVARGDAAAARP